MTEVADGVFDVKLRFVHAFVVIDDDGVTIVDTGTPGSVEAIAAVVARAHRRLEQVHTILVTHRHADHTGSLAALKQRTGARVYIHAADAPVVTGDSPEPAGGLVRKAMLRMLPDAPRTPVDQPLRGGEQIGTIEALHTPGHTPATCRSCCTATAASCLPATPPAAVGAASSRRPAS